MVLFLLVLVVAIVLGIVGAVVHGMLFLLAAAVFVFLADVGWLVMRSAWHTRQRSPR